MDIKKFLNDDVTKVSVGIISGAILGAMACKILDVESGKWTLEEIRNMHKDVNRGDPSDRHKIPCIRTCGCTCGCNNDVECKCFCLICDEVRRLRNARLVECEHCFYIAPDYVMRYRDCCPHCNEPHKKD